MKLSHGTRISEYNDTNGYGYATVSMLASLTRLGHEVKPNWGEAPVEIWFDQPQHWKFPFNKYKIGYHPWESTKLKEGWVEIMNSCDEIWTPSPIVAEWYKEDGIKVPIYVYEHGVDPIWAPKKRTIEDKIKFLHVGGEAARKGGSHTMQAFRAAFPDRKDVMLTMKMQSEGWKIPQIGKITILNERLELDDLIRTYHDHHIFVYPSFGEGFGLNPLQAMSTGMPTISVGAWAPYERFMDPKLNIPSKLRKSPWHNTVHPGKMYRPDFDALVDIMRYAADNYDEVQDFAHSQIAGIRKDYDWDTITADTFEKLEKRL